jgi:hypothetical protein
MTSGQQQISSRDSLFNPLPFALRVIPVDPELHIRIDGKAPFQASVTCFDSYPKAGRPF